MTFFTVFLCFAHANELCRSNLSLHARLGVTLDGARWLGEGELDRRAGTGLKKLLISTSATRLKAQGTQVTLPNLHKRSEASGNITARPIFWSQVMRGQEKMGSTAQSAAAFTPMIL